MISPLSMLVVLVAAVIGIGSVFLTKTEDNPVEEAMEDVIDMKLNLPPGSIDLTPNSKKK